MRLLRVVLLILILSFPAVAQGAPDAINDALAAFNQRMGRNFTLNDLYWTWEQRVYLNSALECPERGELLTQGSYIGYSFKFTFAEEVYEYRVSADRTKTRYCGRESQIGLSTDLIDAVGIDDPLEVSNSLCPAAPAIDKIYIRSRLTGGVEGRISAGGGALNLRDTPSTSGRVITQMPELTTFTVTDRAIPACDSEGYVWWPVLYNGQNGYVAEGLKGAYFIEPVPPTAILNQANPVITAAGLPALTEVAELQGNFQSTAVAWSNTNRLVVLGETGSEGVWIYNAGDLAASPRQYKTNTRMIRAAFGTGKDQDDLLMLGSDEGTVHLWDVSPTSLLTERLVLNGHDSPITAIAISPAGGRIASTGGTAFATTAQPDNLHAILLWDIDTVSQAFALRGHTDVVTAMAFSPDGTTLATASLDKSVRLWNVATGEQSALIDAGAGGTALTFSPDGSLLAIGFDDGTTIALNLVGGLSAGPVLATHNAAVSGLTFTPDGATLLSVGLDSALAAREASTLLTGGDATRFTFPIEGGDALALSPNGAVIAAPLRYATLRLLISAGS